MASYKLLRPGLRYARVNLKRRLYWSMLVSAVILTVSFTLGDTAYTYDGNSYDMGEEKKYSRGRIVEFTNGDEFCTSWVIIPGTSLITPFLLAPVYFIFLVYLFLGIALISDIFMD